jgi:4-diphosphocytidyl-2-C-methyl-D-erythritol kinase
VFRLFSPAKVNLFLNVLSKRPDGYHELRTLFERIDLGDTLTFRKKPSGVTLRLPAGRQARGACGVPKDGRNLILKAAELLQKELRVSQGAEITLLKRIPVAAGLGGGSSNAASALIGLNRLWRLKLTRKRLLGLASRLGSDVPFFILEKPFAYAKGRGEILQPLSRPGKKLWHCLIKPPFGISTKAAYSGLGRHFLTPPGTNVKMLFRALKTGDPGPLRGLLTNSLETALNKRVKTISGIKQKLVFEGAFASLMSGSGSTVFGLFRNEAQARRAALNLKKKNRRWQVIVAATY